MKLARVVAASARVTVGVPPTCVHAYVRWGVAGIRVFAATGQGYLAGFGHVARGAGNGSGRVIDAGDGENDRRRGAVGRPYQEPLGDGGVLNQPRRCGVAVSSV